MLWLLLALMARVGAAGIISVAISGGNYSRLMYEFPNATVLLTVESADPARALQRMSSVIEENPGWRVVSAPSVKYEPSDTDWSLLDLMSVGTASALFLLALFVFACTGDDDRKQISVRI
jgi:hypothetical protein